MFVSILRGPGQYGADFRWLVIAAILNSTGIGGEFVLIGLLPLLATGSSASVGITLAFYYLPMLLFGVPAGAVSDRIDRRTMLRRTEVGLIVSLCLFALVIDFGHSGLVPVIAMTALLGSLRAVYHPVRLSFAYDLAGAQHAVGAISWIAVSTRLGMFTGAIVAGTAVQRWGAQWAIMLLVVAELLALASLLQLRSAGVAAQRDESPIRQNIADYAREFGVNRLLLSLTVVTALIEIFGTSFLTVLPELALHRLSSDPEGLGWLHATQAGGGLVVGLGLAGAAGLRRRGGIFIGVIVGLGLSLMLLGAMTSFTGAILVLVLVSGLIAAWDILTQSMMQLCVPNRLRGRAMGAWVFAIGSSPLGHLEMGFLAAGFGVDIALYLNGAGVVAVILLAALLAPQLRRM